MLASITHGPILSGVTDSSAVIFFRTNQAAGVAIEYSTNPDLSDSVVTPEQVTSTGSDYTVHIPITGLKPLTRYYYTARVDGQRVVIGEYPTFVSFQEADAVVDFSFAVIADASINHVASGFIYNVIHNVAPAFVLKIGDFDHRDPALLSDPPDIEDWRTMHKDVIRNTDAGILFAKLVGPNFPVMSMWDDHDYGSNNADKDEPWKSIALRAYREYHPNYGPANSSGGLWYSFRYAQSEFFVLDLRYQRDAIWDKDDDGKSMLDGDEIENDQKDWLRAGLSNSTATWKFIVSSVPWNPTVMKQDSWTAYQTERTELLDYINVNNIENVIFISGDIHTGGAIDDGTNSDLPEISVPHFNDPVTMFMSGCAAIECGDWSEGIIHGHNAPGLGYISVSGDSSVTLLTWSADGYNQISLEVFAE
jgi:alkaline phosphatase D